MAKNRCIQLVACCCGTSYKESARNYKPLSHRPRPLFKDELARFQSKHIPLGLNPQLLQDLASVGATVAGHVEHEWHRRSDSVALPVWEVISAPSRTE